MPCAYIYDKWSINSNCYYVLHTVPYSIMCFISTITSLWTFCCGFLHRCVSLWCQLMDWTCSIWTTGLSVISSSQVPEQWLWKLWKKQNTEDKLNVFLSFSSVHVKCSESWLSFFESKPLVKRDTNPCFDKRASSSTVTRL